MTVQIEFFGVLRSRAGCTVTPLDADCLADVFRQLVRLHPAVMDYCMQDGQLGSACLVSVNGRHFTRDVTTQLNDGDSVLLLEADAGG